MKHKKTNSKKQSISIFKKVDTFIFLKLKDLQRSEIAVQLDSMQASLTDIQKKILNHTLTITVIFLPVLILTLIYTQNLRLKSQIDIKEQIESEIEIFKNKKIQLISTGRGSWSHLVLNTKQDFSAQIDQLKATLGLKKGNISVSSFDQASESTLITKNFAKIKFNDLTTKHLTKALKSLMIRNKLKIKFLKAKTNLKTSLISGILEVVHLKKNK